MTTYLLISFSSDYDKLGGDLLRKEVQDKTGFVIQCIHGDPNDPRMATIHSLEKEANKDPNLTVKL